MLTTTALVLSLSLGAESTASKVVDVVLIGLSGAAVTAGYTTAAVLIGDRPAGHPLAIVGGAVSLGAVGMSVGLLVNSQRKDPGSFVSFILTPLLAGLAGAALGGVLGHFGSVEPGPLRTATHGVVIGLLLTDAFIFDLVRALD